MNLHQLIMDSSMLVIL